MNATDAYKRFHRKNIMNWNWRATELAYMSNEQICYFNVDSCMRGARVADDILSHMAVVSGGVVRQLLFHAYSILNFSIFYLTRIHNHGMNKSMAVSCRISSGWCEYGKSKYTQFTIAHRPNKMAHNLIYLDSSGKFSSRKLLHCAFCVIRWFVSQGIAREPGDMKTDTWSAYQNEECRCNCILIKARNWKAIVRMLFGFEGSNTCTSTALIRQRPNVIIIPLVDCRRWILRSIEIICLRSHCIDRVKFYQLISTDKGNKLIFK